MSQAILLWKAVSPCTLEVYRRTEFCLTEQKWRLEPDDSPRTMGAGQGLWHPPLGKLRPEGPRLKPGLCSETYLGGKLLAELRFFSPQIVRTDTWPLLLSSAWHDCGRQLLPLLCCRQDCVRLSTVTDLIWNSFNNNKGLEAGCNWTHSISFTFSLCLSLTLPSSLTLILRTLAIVNVH